MDEQKIFVKMGGCLQRVNVHLLGYSDDDPPVGLAGDNPCLTGAAPRVCPGMPLRIGRMCPVGTAEVPYGSPVVPGIWRVRTRFIGSLADTNCREADDSDCGFG